MARVPLPLRARASRTLRAHNAPTKCLHCCVQRCRISGSATRAFVFAVVVTSLAHVGCLGNALEHKMYNRNVDECRHINKSIVVIVTVNSCCCCCFCVCVYVCVYVVCVYICCLSLHARTDRHVSDRVERRSASLYIFSFLYMSQ